MHGVADIEPGQVHVEMLGDGIDRAADLDLVAHHVHDATALQARRSGLIDEAHRHRHGNQGVLAHAHEIHMDGEVAHGVELHVARDDARLGPLHVEREHGALEVAGMELLEDRLIVDGDGLRRVLVAVENAGNASLAANLARAALAGARPYPSLEFHRLSHDFLRSSEIMKGREAAPKGRTRAFGVSRTGIGTAYSPTAKAMTMRD